MRFIHMADMHFDCPFTVLSSHEELGDLRRLEQRKIFNKIIEYIKVNKIPYLFIAGDLIEHQYVRKTTIEFINNLFKEIPETKILITPGNHDPALKNSFYNTFSWNTNVYIFNPELSKLEFNDCDIYGFGFDDFYCNKTIINEIKIENKNKINILIMHGDLNASESVKFAYNPINENKLKEIGFDYIALGHIHKKIIKDKIVYPGSTIALGFDEFGEHGIFDVELEKNKNNLNFIKLDDYEFVEKDIDISDIKTEDELIEKINNEKWNENKLFKIIFTGERKIEINKDKLLKIINIKNIIKIKDESKLGYNIEEISKENNLKGYFVREVLKMQNENGYSNEDTSKIIEIGLNAL